MFREDGWRPNDQRGFIHKKLFGLGKKLLGATPIGAAVKTAFSIVKPKARTVAPRSTTARSSVAGQQRKALGRSLKFPEIEAGAFVPQALTLGSPASFNGGAQPCPDGTIPDPKGRGFCVAPDSPVGRKARGLQPVGAAVNGRYGAALEPGVVMIERSVCLPGMQLGNDGLCYNKGAITNKERQWPRGRAPLLTGGEMKAIAIAARAGAKVERATKRLRALGVMKKLPAPRRALPAHQHAKQIAAVSV